MDHTAVDPIYEQLENILSLSDELLRKEYDAQIPSNLDPPSTFWSGYNEEQIKYGLKSCLLLWIASLSRLVPREFQLRAIISTMSGQDSLIDVGTGNGKTLCMIIPCLLSPKTISVVISPLKRLQAVQVLEFERYHVKTLAINEDTPNDPELWKV
jgi:superfamily II DNA/RNA helicase